MNKGFIKIGTIIVGLILGFLVGVGLFAPATTQKAQATNHGYVWEKTSETPCEPKCGEQGATHQVTYTCKDGPGSAHDQCGFDKVWDACPQGYNVLLGISCIKNSSPYNVIARPSHLVPATKTVTEECSVPAEQVKACEPEPCDQGPVEASKYSMSTVNDTVPQPQDPCVTPTVTVTPTPGDPGQGNVPENPSTNTTGAPGVCSDTVPGDVANINVLSGTPNDGKVTVQWSLPSGASQVHIRYGKYSDEGYPHALLNTPNDGNEEIGALTNGTNYKFQVAGVNGCAVGNYSKSFDPKP